MTVTRTHLLGLPAGGFRFPPQRYSGVLVGRSTQGSNIFPNGASTNAPWETVYFDTDGFWNSANPTRLTNPLSFPIHVHGAAGIVVSTSVGSGGGMFASKNGSTSTFPSAQTIVGGTNGSSLLFPPQILLPGEYLEVGLTNTSGSNEIFSLTFSRCFFALEARWP